MPILGRIEEVDDVKYLKAMERLNEFYAEKRRKKTYRHERGMAKVVTDDLDKFLELT